MFLILWSLFLGACLLFAASRWRPEPVSRPTESCVEQWLQDQDRPFLVCSRGLYDP